MQPLAVRARAQARRWFDFVLDLLYPPRCGGCGAAGAGLWCESCQRLVQRLPVGDQTTDYPLATPAGKVKLAIISAALFASPLREAIHALKYEGVPGMAEPLSMFIHEVWRQNGIHADVIVPVPLHPRRQRERGYNQSELLARQLGACVGVPVDMCVLERRRHTEQQVHLSAPERRQNVLGAFAASPMRSNGKQIVLLDDVFTTGATLGECAQALLDAGAAHVCAVTLAKAL
ncbi:MAG: ComF family protein [Chloroflexi bacterium]|nr:ComF family protein [Chloroflexota bacterium]